MRSPVVELLADLSAALDEAGIPWYLFGAQAALLYGAARLTADVDVTVNLPEAITQSAMADSIETHRFRRRVADPAFIARTRVMPFVHLPTGLPLDIVLAGPGIEEQFFARARIHPIDGVPVRVASPEDIVVMKVLAGRPKDLDDVAAIVAAQGNGLDAAAVRRTLRLLEQALAQSDLLPAFDAAEARAGRPGV